MIATFIKSVAEAALRQGEFLLRDWLPGGTLNGDEYDVRNPRRADDDCIGNFRVNVRTGEWSDFAMDGIKGSDWVSLFAYLRGDIRQLDAAKQVAQQVGHPAYQGKNGKLIDAAGLLNRKKTGKKAEQSGEAAKGNKQKDYWADWRIVMPVPGIAPEPPTRHVGWKGQPSLGEPNSVWPYRDADGNVNFYIYMFAKPDGDKDPRPLSLWVREDRMLKWRWKGPEKDRPLFGLDELFAKPDAPVLVVEGEKCANAAMELLPDWASVTSSFGSGSANKSDWSDLKGRDLVIWPDRDAAGLKYAAAVTRLAREAGAASIRQVDWNDAPDDLKTTLSVGTDIADLPGFGWTVEQIAAMVEGAKARETGEKADGISSRKQFFPERHSPQSQSSQADEEEGADDEEDPDRKLVWTTIARCQEDPGVLRSPEFIAAWQRIRADDPEEDIRIRVAIKKAKPSGVLLSDLDEAVRGDESAAGQETTADVIVAMVLERAELFHDADRSPFATVKEGPRCQTFKIGTQAFMDWLSFSYYESTAEKSQNGLGHAVGDTVLKSAVTALSGIAKHGSEERPCYLRAAPWGEGYIIDLGGSLWRAVEVTPAGWTILDTPPVRFWRPNTLHSLPLPVPGGDLSALWEFVNVPEETRPLVLAWMLEAFRPDTPFVVLELCGQHGSAKSSTQEKLRRLIDPNAVNLRAAPKTTEDLFVGAGCNWMVSMNNLSNLTFQQQDALCTMATGGGFAGRTLYTNADETVVECKRPVVINGINPVVTAQDLTDRIVHVELPEIPAYRSEIELNAAFKSALPALFGSLLDLFVATLAKLPEVTLEKPPRMVDFALLGDAMMQAGGDEPGAFMHLFAENRRESTIRGLDASPVGLAVKELAEAANDAFVFEGNMKQLLAALDRFRPMGDAWPKSPRGLSDALRRQRPALAAVGVQVNIDAHTRAGVMVRILKGEPAAAKRDDRDDGEGGFEKSSSGKKKVDAESLSADAAMLWEELRTVKGFAEALWFSQKLAWAIDRVRDAANELKQLGFATVAGPLIGPVKRQAA